MLINHDRYGLFRPTKDVPFSTNQHSNSGDRPDGEKEVQDRPQWRTTRNCHLDMNPWRFIESASSAESDEVLASLRYEEEMDFITENNEVGAFKDNRLHVQALINLIDNREADGGFHIVPGFKHHFVEWANNTQADLKHRYISLALFSLAFACALSHSLSPSLFPPSLPSHLSHPLSSRFPLPSHQTTTLGMPRIRPSLCCPMMNLYKLSLCE